MLNIANWASYPYTSMKILMNSQMKVTSKSMHCIGSIGSSMILMLAPTSLSPTFPGPPPAITAQGPAVSGPPADCLTLHRFHQYTATLVLGSHASHAYSCSYDQSTPTVYSFFYYNSYLFLLTNQHFSVCFIAIYYQDQSENKYKHIYIIYFFWSWILRLYTKANNL